MNSALIRSRICSTGEDMSTESAINSTVQELATQIARDHIHSSKRWPEKDFHVEVLRSEGSPSSPIIIVDAVHHDDLNLEGRGSTSSVQLHIDLNARRVLKE